VIEKYIRRTIDLVRKLDLDKLRVSYLFGIYKIGVERSPPEYYKKLEDGVETELPASIVSQQIPKTEIIISDGKLPVGYFHLGKKRLHYLRVGDYVSKGRVLGYVEAIGTRDEVISKYKGIVKTIFVLPEDEKEMEIFFKRGVLVQYGTKLFEIELMGEN